MSSGGSTSKEVKDLGPYLVSRNRLGFGSYATVFEGFEKLTNRKVAVKSINRDRLNRKLIENLELEISILQILDHPNVVKLYHVHRSVRHIYLVLEFCEGGDLAKLVKKTGPLSEPIVNRFTRDIAQALVLLRSRDLVHRDLKPHNLLLTSSDLAAARIKLTDFGFARYMVPSSLAETVCGSPLYMAPEILSMKKYDARADLWSVGTILYELAYGKPPFSGMNHLDLLKNIESTSVSFPSSVSISDSLKNLLTALLQRDPERRLSFDQFFHHPFVQLDLESATNLAKSCFYGGMIPQDVKAVPLSPAPSVASPISNGLGAPQPPFSVAAQQQQQQQQVPTGGKGEMRHPLNDRGAERNERMDSQGTFDSPVSNIAKNSAAAPTSRNPVSSRIIRYEDCELMFRAVGVLCDWLRSRRKDASIDPANVVVVAMNIAVQVGSELKKLSVTEKESSAGGLQLMSKNLRSYVSDLNGRFADFVMASEDPDASVVVEATLYLCALDFGSRATVEEKMDNGKEARNRYVAAKILLEYLEKYREGVSDTDRQDLRSLQRFIDFRIESCKQ
eukprot:ANDGO_03696.mRNA.1 Serine/threonine-protein kinase ATG1